MSWALWFGTFSAPVPVFLSDLEGQSEHHTSGDLLSASDVPGDLAAWPSEGSLHTVVINVCSWRDRTGYAMGA